MWMLRTRACPVGAGARAPRQHPQTRPSLDAILHAQGAAPGVEILEGGVLHLLQQTKGIFNLNLRHATAQGWDPWRGAEDSHPVLEVACHSKAPNVDERC